MTEVNEQASGATPAAGAGRLAQVIATRGGTASPEAPFRIEHREALIYMLCEAAELEHGIMCQYLFAAFSLKQRADEGLSGPELDATQRWRRAVTHIATQEMLHLALVHNLLSAIGAAPHLARPNLPHPANHYPAGVQLVLLPFGEEALRHFMFLERPEGMALEDADGLAAMGRAQPQMAAADIVPRSQDFATIGHLYRSIEAGLAHLSDVLGERRLFVGPSRAQATAANFRWPELVAVTDLASAQRAIDCILDQGEGPRGDWRHAHFGQFVDILDEYEQLRASNPRFDPTRPVLAANVRPNERGVEVPMIEHTVTARCADLFNVAYEILLQLFERYFAHTSESDAQLATLADMTLALMFEVIEPLGDVLTTLPVGGRFGKRTAGPSFELFYENDYLMPHRQAAWALLAERLDEAAAFCERIRSKWGDEVGESLSPVSAALTRVARSLGPPPAGAVAMDDDTRAALRERADQYAAIAQHGALFDAAYRLALRALDGDTDTTADFAQRAARRLVDSVLRPVAEASVDVAGADDSVGSMSDGFGDALWQLTQATTSSRVRADVGDRPDATALMEATAALQDLACELAPSHARRSHLDELRASQAALSAAIEPAPNGPYLVTNVDRLTDWLGQPIPTRPQMALCRCGQSARKPLCDGTHADVGFRDDKDPKRVPDRRDTYDGVQITVLDNRGICQHSGLCSDRLAAVFRVDEEPFVAPSGGRMDEIIRAVRDCPSGALSYAIEGREARDHVDWSHRRDAVIEVTKDGPYRITGGLPLIDSHGDDIERNVGASREHYALCRCGHSQNKPFCSGMHWYVEFRDPLPDRTREPTLFEWAGGLPALTRTTRLLYEKYIPADALLAHRYSQVDVEHPQHIARTIAAAFGARESDVRGGEPPQLLDPTFSDAERARWAELFVRAATDARLPSEPQFRSALISYLQFHAGAAGSTSPSGTTRWDWGPGGAPPWPAEHVDEGSHDEAVTLPTADEIVSFERHIRPLFRDKDRQSMRFAFDLRSYDDVATNAEPILERLRQGSMPCDGAWPNERIDVIARWVASGKNP